MSCQRHLEEFKIEAVKQVIKKANLLPISPSAWRRPSTACMPDQGLQQAPSAASARRC